ncbi:thiamine phosphate synthase [Qingshengfaniella alkalisoli]|uniref:Thiamine phosphate synthase n=1 Tax=Qingshengfaniella alkalisoli TaxID=2599296 RepID=A0A5B8IU06_9RHOB|nr:thiamine phosphate synthase [Qingshengfaniella alkalisoli]QDY68953.1 thiamine phosphate synthase [Qingshengfaniella alkalisoli]
MAETEQPQLYLVTPASPSPDSFPDQLARVLDTTEIACLRLRTATQDEDEIGRIADALRDVAHRRDIPLVIDSHVQLVERHGLDGVHLLDGSKLVRKTRKALGADAIVGAYCGTSRHDGISAGEAGADYVSFGPAGPTVLGDGSKAEAELFAWWSDMIEMPVIAEGALDVTTIAQLAQITDFFAIGDEIWREDDPAAALKLLVQAIG